MSCTECGEEGTPPETMRLVEQFFSGDIEPDSIDDTPVIHEKSA